MCIFLPVCENHDSFHNKGEVSYGIFISIKKNKRLFFLQTVSFTLRILQLVI